MKRIRKIIMVLVVLGMIMVFARQASASWYWVSVLSITVNDVGDTEIRVQRDDGARTSFVLPTDQANKMLAMIFACQASDNMQLIILADSWNAGTITSMRLNSPAP